jgi:hypothetical protein
MLLHETLALPSPSRLVVLCLVPLVVVLQC